MRSPGSGGRRRALAVGLAVLGALTASACGKSAPEAGSPATSDEARPGTELVATTPPATAEVDRVTWALYRDTSTVDPLYAFDYPDNTVLAALCESLFRQQPDGTIEPGLAEQADYPDERTLVLTIRDGVTFWDGSELTAEDVVYSLERQRDPKLGGLFAQAFSAVDSITATGPLEVTIALDRPDYWLEGQLSSTPGVIVSKRVVEAEGPKYGTPGGKAMCTGAYELGSWKPGVALSAVRYDGYWDAEHRAKTRQIDFKGVPDEAALTSGLLTGEIGGTYPSAIGTIEQLRSSGKVDVHRGPSQATEAVIISNLDGALGDKRVRQALSMAIDRQGIVDATYKGMARLPRALANPGTWGYAPDVFQAAWDAREDPAVDIEAARKLVTEAGAEGKSVVFGMTNEIKSIATEANAVRGAAEAIGLKVKLRAVSAANFISFFVDPKAREGIDGFFTVNYPEFADPAALYATLALPDGTQNFSGYENADVTRLLGEARSTADPDARAKLVVEVEEILNDELPWIPVTAPDNQLILGKDLTGAPASFSYMHSPWAQALGGKE